MDKYEFNIKVEQIKKLVNKKDFATAMKIADTIDWRRVRNANLLSMISQVYEKNNEYQEAKEVLLLAFERAPIGKRLLYKLTELALKEGSLGEAEDYYREFCDLAPEDTRQHILRYMILKEKDAPVDQLIHSLERYTNVELDEKWMYELAELYAKAGRSTDCVLLCDKMILLFGIGTYVEQATDLRQRYAPKNSYQRNVQQNHNTFQGTAGYVTEGNRSVQNSGIGYNGETGYSQGEYGTPFGTGNSYGGESYGAGNGYGGESYGAGNGYGGESYGSGNGYGEESYGSGNGYGGESYGSGNGYGGESYGAGNGYGGESYGAGNGYGGESYGSGNGYGRESFEAGNGYGAESFEVGNSYGGESYGIGNGYRRESYGVGNGYGGENFEAGNGYGAESFGNGNNYSGNSFGAEGRFGTQNGYGETGYGSRNRYAAERGYENGVINDGAVPYGNENVYDTGSPYNMEDTGRNFDTGAGYEYEAAYDVGDSYRGHTSYGNESDFRNNVSSYGTDSSYGADETYEISAQPYRSYSPPGGYIVDEELMANLHQAAAEKELAAEMSRISTEIYEEPEPISNQTRVFHGKNNIRYLRPRAEEEEKPRYDRTYIPHHMIIEAKTAEEGFAAAVEALKKIHQETGITNQAIKISGSKLGQRGIINVSDKLAGKDLIVEEAGDLTQKDLEELQMLLERDETGMIVVLIDNPYQIEELHQQNPGFINLFKCISFEESVEEPAQEIEQDESQYEETCQHEESEEADMPESTIPEEEQELQIEPEEAYLEESEEEAEPDPDQPAESEEETNKQPEIPVIKEEEVADMDETADAEDTDAEDADIQELEEPDEEFYDPEDYDEEEVLDDDLSQDDENQDDEEPYEDEYEEFDAGVPADDDEELEIDAFADYAVQYANEIDCSITGKSMLALYERVETMEENGIPLTRANAEDMIEEAADRAEKPSLGGLIKGVFSSKYDKDGLLILKEEHFI